MTLNTPNENSTPQQRLEKPSDSTVNSIRGNITSRISNALKWLTGNSNQGWWPTPNPNRKMREKISWWPTPNPKKKTEKGWKWGRAT